MENSVFKNIEEHLPMLLSATIGCIIIVLLIGAYIGKTLRNRRVVRKMQRGAKLEQKAGSLLERKGYKIIAFQHPAQYDILVNGNTETISVRFDFLVKQKQKTYLVEVKSGDKAPDPLYAPTRRQMLEYFLVAKSYGILLVDMETEQISTVEFPDFGNNTQFSFCTILLVIVFILLFLYLVQFLF